MFEYIEVFFNRRRRHSTLGFRSPIQFMQDDSDSRPGETGGMRAIAWKAKNRGNLKFRRNNADPHREGRAQQGAAGEPLKRPPERRRWA